VEVGATVTAATDGFLVGLLVAPVTVGALVTGVEVGIAVLGVDVGVSVRDMLGVAVGETVGAIVMVGLLVNGMPHRNVRFSALSRVAHRPLLQRTSTPISVVPSGCVSPHFEYVTGVPSTHIYASSSSL